MSKEGGRGAFADQVGPAILGASQMHTFMRSNFAKSRSARLAIAYWGRGAIEALGIPANTKCEVRILCDLFSGACNPDEVKKLLKHAKVKSLDGLHAKLACFDNAVAIGSSNASANGLGFDGEDVACNIEANIVLNDGEIVDEARGWFEERWADVHAQVVDEDLVESVRPLWHYSAAQRHRQSKNTLVQAVSRGVLKSENVRLVVYRGGEVHKSTEDAYRRVVLPTYTQAALAIYPDEHPFYEDITGWNARPGTILIDFGVNRAKARPAFSGIWRVRTRDPYISAPNPDYPKTRLILCDPLLDIAGYRFPREEQKRIAEAIRDDLNQSGGWDRASPQTHWFLIDEPFQIFCRRTRVI